MLLPQDSLFLNSRGPSSTISLRLTKTHRCHCRLCAGGQGKRRPAAGRPGVKSPGDGSASSSPRPTAAGAWLIEVATSCLLTEPKDSVTPSKADQCHSVFPTCTPVTKWHKMHQVRTLRSGPPGPQLPEETPRANPTPARTSWRTSGTTLSPGGPCRSPVSPAQLPACRRTNTPAMAARSPPTVPSAPGPACSLPPLLASGAKAAWVWSPDEQRGRRG